MGVLGTPLGFPLGGEDDTAYQGAPASTRGTVWAERLRFAWNGVKGRLILRSFAQLLIDKAIDWSTAAATMRFPRQADGTPTDPVALELLGHERQIERGPHESDRSYAFRLESAAAQWKLAGTPIGLLVELHYANFMGCVVVQQNGLGWYLSTPPVFSDLTGIGALPSWVSRVDLGPNPPIPASADGKPAIAAGTIPWWTFDGGMDGDGNQYNSRFGILFPSGATPPDLGTAANLARLSRVVAAWKPTKAKCMGAWVLTAGEFWDWPTGIWDDGSGDLWDAGGTDTYYTV